MKKLKLLGLLFAFVFITGCDVFKMDSMEDINIITTAYPLEYVVKTLYGNHSKVVSIYPTGTNINTYKFKDTQLVEFSKKDLFVYSGFGSDKDIALNLINKNKNLLIIDGSFGMTPSVIEELWLNPSNLLMMAQNVKNGLTEYINSNFLIEEINTNFEELKLELSELDAEIKLTAENAATKTIVTSNDALLFLEKYGFNVIVLNDSTLEKTVNEVESMINASLVKYIFMLEYDEQNSTVKKILANTNAEILSIKRIENLSEAEINNSDNYLTLMRYNLDLLKKELYK